MEKLHVIQLVKVSILGIIFFSSVPNKVAKKAAKNTNMLTLNNTYSLLCKIGS